MTRSGRQSGSAARLMAAALAVAGLGGCVTSRVEESRQMTTGLAVDETLVIMGRTGYGESETEESFTDCMAKALSRGERPLPLIAEDDFRDMLYPWFEPRTAPANAAELASLFAQPGVADMIDATNVRYLAWIDGSTQTIDEGGSLSCTVSTFGGGCFGMAYWEQDASYEAAIWDLKNLGTVGQISADASGTSYVAGLILPIPIIARPGNAACKGLSDQLRQFILDEG